MLDSISRPNLWTDERVTRLRKLWDEGHSCSQIASRLDCGLSRNAVIGKASRLKLPARMTPERKARCYRSGPVSYEEKQRREAERLVRRMIAQRDKRKRKQDGSLPPLHIIEPIKPPDFLALTFGELKPESCRYPRGEGSDMRFCGQPKMQGFSYCQYCYAITHHKPHDTTPRGTNYAVVNLARAA
jgi:GcrA cell cycle regulator